MVLGKQTSQLVELRLQHGYEPLGSFCLICAAAQLCSLLIQARNPLPQSVALNRYLYQILKVTRAFGQVQSEAPSSLANLISGLLSFPQAATDGI